MDTVLPSVLSFIGVLIGVYFMNRHNNRMHKANLEQIRQELQQRQREQDLEVSRLILPKCLEAMQNAFAYIMEINSLLAKEHALVTLAGKVIDTTGAHYSEVCDGLRAVRKWYDNHCLYLPKDVRGNVVTLINFAHRHYLDLSQGRQPDHRVYGKLMDLVRTLRQYFDGFMSRYNLIESLLERDTRHSA
ncbi:MAG: hypothetical protein AB1744_03670 [Candidatus Zixiibacteriota bacterium]